MHNVLIYVRGFGRQKRMALLAPPWRWPICLNPDGNGDDRRRREHHCDNYAGSLTYLEGKAHRILYCEHVLDRIPSFCRNAEPSFSGDQSVHFMTVLQESIASQRRLLGDIFVANT